MVFPKKWISFSYCDHHSTFTSNSKQKIYDRYLTTDLVDPRIKRRDREIGEKVIKMFWSCSVLQTIYVVDDWSMSDMVLAVTRNMFKDCNSLVSGQGTTYDANHVDADYAHID